jgi:hypothetical protein
MSNTTVFIAFLINALFVWIISVIVFFASQYFGFTENYETILAGCVVINACAWVLSYKKE